MKTLTELLASDVFKPLMDKTANLQRLNAVWSIIMQEWAEHCVVADFEKGELLLQVRNAAWATRVRYAVPEIIKKLGGHAEFKLLNKIKCKISPHCPLFKYE
ncbi:MAG: DUF721 domain-containing protein [Gammaproteobacteria bacterium]|nr:DUF721 domain-containing protein [Gammaproteobacteria bacterium]